MKKIEFESVISRFFRSAAIGGLFICVCLITNCVTPNNSLSMFGPPEPDVCDNPQNTNDPIQIADTQNTSFQPLEGSDYPRLEQKEQPSIWFSVERREYEDTLPVFIFMEGFFSVDEQITRPHLSAYIKEHVDKFHSGIDLPTTIICGHSPVRGPLKIRQPGGHQYPAGMSTLFYPHLALPGRPNSDLDLEAHVLFYLMHHHPEFEEYFFKRYPQTELFRYQGRVVFRGADRVSGTLYKGIIDEIYQRTAKKVSVNFIAESAGALKVRRYLQLCEQWGVDHHTERVFIIAGANQGAEIAGQVSRFISAVLQAALERFELAMIDGESVNVRQAGIAKEISYGELYEKTLLGKIHGTGIFTWLRRFLLTWYVVNFIPFHEDVVLGDLKTVEQLDPQGNFVKSVSKFPFPEEIQVINVRAEQPVHTLYNTLLTGLQKIDQNAKGDGFLTLQDTYLAGPNVVDYVLPQPADHAAIKEFTSFSEMEELIEEYYDDLVRILEQPATRSKLQNMLLLQGFFKSIAACLGYDMDAITNNEGKHKEVTVLDRFIESGLMELFFISN